MEKDKIDICPKDGNFLEQGFDPYIDGAKCPECKEIYYSE